MKRLCVSPVLLVFLWGVLSLTVCCDPLPWWVGGALVAPISLLLPKRWIPFLLLLTCISLCAQWANGKSALHLGLPAWQVSSVVGVLDDDSSLTERGGQFLRLHLRSCQNSYGSCVTSSGCVTSLVGEGRMIPSGSTIQLWGRMGEDGFFSAKDWQVLHMGQGGRMRLGLVVTLHRLLKEAIPRRSDRSLALMLLLGRSDSDSFPLRTLAMESGCSHILALSGMHLGAVSAVITRMVSAVSTSFIGSIAGLTFSFLFVLLVGPKPSLVRALLFRLFLVALRGKPLCAPLSLALSLVVQLLLFPYHLSSLGFVLSYLACAALLLAPELTRGMHPFLSMEVLGMVVAVMTMPVTVHCMGKANLGAIFLSTPSSLLILLAWHLSFFSLCHIPLCARLLGLDVRLLVKLLSSCASFPLLDVGPDNLYQALGLLLTVLFLLGYAERQLIKGRRRRYELEIRLRFPSGDQDGAESSGHGHVQAVRAELSDCDARP